MKGIVESILESLSNENVITYRGSLDGFSLDHLIGNNLKSLGRFLKGSDRLSGLTIHFSDSNKYVHIHRYADMHGIELVMLATDSKDWPDKEDMWKNAVTWLELDDRDSQKNLLNRFAEWLNSHLYMLVD